MFPRTARGVDSRARIVSKIDAEFKSAASASDSFARLGALKGLAGSGIKGFIIIHRTSIIPIRMNNTLVSSYIFLDLGDNGTKATVHGHGHRA